MSPACDSVAIAAPVDRIGRGFDVGFRTWSELRQRPERVDLAPRGDRIRSVDALCADVHGRPDVGVAVEQVQRLAVVGHLVAPIGPGDDPEGLPADAWSGFGPLRGQYR